MTSSVAAVRVRSRSGRLFYLGIGLAIIAAVVIGFSRTIDEGLLHPPSPRPLTLHVHVALFTAWLLVYVAQVVLVGARKMRWHRRLGYASIGLGSAMVVSGAATTIVMTQLRAAEGGGDGAAAMAGPLFDMVAFAVLFALAIIWRFEPEYHRRVILMASCGLTAAAFGRFPHFVVPAHCWYIAVDLLIVVAVVRDLLTTRRVHAVYGVGLPLLAAGQAFAMWLALHQPEWWLRVAHWML